MSLERDLEHHGPFHGRSKIRRKVVFEFFWTRFKMYLLCVIQSTVQIQREKHPLWCITKLKIKIKTTFQVIVDFSPKAQLKHYFPLHIKFSNPRYHSVLQPFLLNTQLTCISFSCPNSPFHMIPPLHISIFSD